MIFVIGEILFDLFPDTKRLGGAPFNFAFHLKRLGFPVRFISRVGRDVNGQEILAYVKNAGFDPDDIQIDDARPTGTVRVTVDDSGVPRFEIQPDVAYDNIQYLPDRHTGLIDRSRILYFGTLVQRSQQGFHRIQQFLDHKPPGCRSFCDINLRSGGYSTKTIQTALRKADILKLNMDELRKCQQIFGSRQAPLDLIHPMMAEYALAMVAVTRGDRGSALYTPQGVSRVAAAPVNAMADTVGAGDAFAAMLTAGILNDWPHQKTLAMAAAFAARICTIPGAVPVSPDFYEPVQQKIRNGAGYVF